jgi:hypothetical protein
MMRRIQNRHRLLNIAARESKRPPRDGAAFGLIGFGVCGLCGVGDVKGIQRICGFTQ